SRDDADDVVVLAVHVDDDEEPDRRAEAQEQEAILVARVIRVLDEERELVGEDRGGLLEGDAVLGLVGGGLARVPFESDVGHAASVTTPYAQGKGAARPGLPNGVGAVLHAAACSSEAGGLAIMVPARRRVSARAMC